MRLEDQAAAVAAALSPASEPGRLQILCRAAAEQLCAGLKPGLTQEDCGSSLELAAALLALSYESAGQSLSGERIQVGDFSMSSSGSGGRTAALLREQAMTLMGPFLAERDFGFQGVKSR